MFMLQIFKIKSVLYDINVLASWLSESFQLYCLVFPFQIFKHLIPFPHKAQSFEGLDSINYLLLTVHRFTISVFTLILNTLYINCEVPTKDSNYQ